MLLALDIGNSSISAGVYAIHSDRMTHTLICTFKISSKFMTADEYAIAFHNFLQLHNIRSKLQSNIKHLSVSESDDRVIDCAVIASVVPALTDILAKAVVQLCGKPPFIIGQGTRTGFGIKIKNPEQLGADIVANTTAALAVCEPPLVILDVGTATTLTVVDENRDLLGIVIMPGLKISMSALSLSAAQLSDVRLERPEELIGRDTSSSIRSGVINGQIYAIDGFIRNVREQLHTKESGKSLGLIATGGLANYVLPYMRNKFTYDETLTLSGEVYLFRKNIRSIDG